jgi:hypothetical protein
VFNPFRQGMKSDSLNLGLGFGLGCPVGESAGNLLDLGDELAAIFPIKGDGEFALAIKIIFGAGEGNVAFRASGSRRGRAVSRTKPNGITFGPQDGPQKNFSRKKGLRSARKPLK